MPRGVYERTEAHRRAISLAHIGKKHSSATKEKQRVSHRGKPSGLLGKTYEEIYGEEGARKRIAKLKAHRGEGHGNFGKVRSPAARKNYRLAKLGEKNFNFGKPSNRCGKTYEEIYGIEGAKELQKKLSGPNSNFYRDGKSNEPYGIEFTDALKLKIRKRDDFMCQFPGCGKLENGKAHHVHHIDHNKHNNNEFNLILLDSSCHEKEKFMNLDDAILMFEDILRVRNILR